MKKNPIKTEKDYEKKSINLMREINTVVDKRQKGLIKYLYHLDKEIPEHVYNYNEYSKAFISFDNNIKIALDNLRFITKERYDWDISNEIIQKYQNILQQIGLFSLNYDSEKRINLEFFDSIGYFIKEYYFELEVSFIINTIRNDEIINEVKKKELDYDFFNWFFCYFQIEKSIEFKIYRSFLTVIEDTLKNKYKNTTSAKRELINIIKTKSKNIDLFWSELLHYKKIQQYDRLMFSTIARIGQLKIRNEDLQILNIKLQKEKIESEEKFKTAKKVNKKEQLKKYKNNNKPNSWDDVIIVYIESTNQFDYESIKGLKPFELSEERTKLLNLIVTSKEKPQNIDFKHIKYTFSRLNTDLKQLFNKNTNPLDWNENQKVYKIHFKYRIYENSNQYKETQLTPEIEARLQSNQDEMED